MKLSSYATYVIVPLHLISGCLFGLLPNSPYDSAYYSLYSAIVLLLVLTVVVYGMLVHYLRPGVALIWIQCGIASMVAAVPAYALEFSDPWHLLMYPLVQGASLLACLLVGNAVALMARN
ncbi:hypothetical protein [Denitrobaculum tricleocarpae]|uniref:Uncharacterized protein n=1 Tax=Denitrobaculum tricleocarpae TaxID=2591009 RepID=A0A545TMT4_9PROT|nr:hypothetical protein [Denitrobaculum tricleocarpae]TQV78488.1 hypothetical protein FKG95_18170 [Denitrobaculum tricleocarpae]